MHSITSKSRFSGIRMASHESWLYHLQVVWLWEDYLSFSVPQFPLLSNVIIKSSLKHCCGLNENILIKGHGTKPATYCFKKVGTVAIVNRISFLFGISEIFLSLSLSLCQNIFIFSALHFYRFDYFSSNICACMFFPKQWAEWLFLREHISSWLLAQEVIILALPSIALHFPSVSNIIEMIQVFCKSGSILSFYWLYLRLKFYLPNGEFG